MTTGEFHNLRSKGEVKAARERMKLDLIKRGSKFLSETVKLLDATDDRHEKRVKKYYKLDLTKWANVRDLLCGFYYSLVYIHNEGEDVRKQLTEAEGIIREFEAIEGKRLLRLSAVA